MSVLSDSIEQFIQALFNDAPGAVDVQRNELAAYFSCAPSQINYVLSTRFTPERGYIIQSRRGGGGYIRITHYRPDGQEALLRLLAARTQNNALTASQAARILADLQHNEVITPREQQLMAGALQPVALPIPQQLKDALRAEIMRNMLAQLSAFQAAQGQPAEQEEKA